MTVCSRADPEPPPQVLLCVHKAAPGPMSDADIFTPVIYKLDIGERALPDSGC